MIVGIDLGTTNSAVAVYDGGRARLVPNALGELLTPSAVSVDRDGMLYVGAAALDRVATDPSNTATSFKRLMGTTRMTMLGGSPFKAEELSAMLLGSLRDDVLAYAGETPREAVITVPAYFNDRQRKATRRAAELAGLSVRRLLNEPTAAALAFGLQTAGDREAFLVFDLGGGTFDVSIVEMFDGIVEVRASAGDNRLGGDDFTAALLASVVDRLDPEHALDALSPEKRAATLAQAAERTRKMLSTRDAAAFTVTVGDARLETTVDEAEFEAACESLLQRLRDPVRRSLRDCRLDVARLSDIVVVGGATRMPIVRRAIARMFGRFPNTSVDPDRAVALGAAIQAGLLAKDRALDEVRITDVCPFTLGIDISARDGRGGLQRGLFSPIIERNTALPVSRVRSYVTTCDNQRKFAIGIYQGEAREVAGNVKLASLEVPIPPRPVGAVGMEVRFSYDSSGLLEVDVSVPASGLTRNVVIVDDEDGANRGDLERRRSELATLKVHPRDEAANVALVARAERLYEELLGDDRLEVGSAITRMSGALQSQDPRLIADARAALESALDVLESPVLL